MTSAAALRHSVQDSLGERFSGALSPRLKPDLEHLPSGVAALDAVLHGGLPVGVITEFVGAEGSGRMTAATAFVAAAGRAGTVCAWIDVLDAFDPESAAAGGVDLERLLWVRCTAQECTPAPQAREQSHAGTPGSPLSFPETTTESLAPARSTGGGSPHPRSEGRGMPQAVSALLGADAGADRRLQDRHARQQKRSAGTPGMPNRPLSYRSAHREEQPNSDRLPPRRGEHLAVVSPRTQPRLIAAGQRMTAAVTGPPAHRQKPWPLLDQALRATDLLLQGGGFSVIVLDLAGVPAEAAWRIPLATWFRFRAACEHARVSLVLLTQHPCARSAAELVVRLQPAELLADSRVMTGMHHHAATERNRGHEPSSRVVPIRKPPQSAPADPWKSRAAWA